MSLAIIDLNDSEVRIADQTGILFRSPGYALYDNGSLLLGEAALQQSRLKPRAVFDRFWNQLNQDPLKNPPAQYRHHADLAFAHLQTTHEQAGQPEEVIFAVPGSYSNEQLALLLGLAEAAPFRAVGLVDSAVAAASAAAGEGNYLLADLHLHRTVITHLQVAESVTRQSVQVVEGTGLAEILDACAYTIADLFIKQSRFDPQHLPETEQSLYNQIYDSLARLQRDGEIMLEITSQDVLHQAKLTPATVADALQNHYRRIINAIPAGSQCLLSSRMAVLPGFTDLINCQGVLDEQCVFNGCRENLTEIRSADTGPALNFVTSLPAAARPGIRQTQAARTVAAHETGPGAEPATHILHNSQAWPLDKGSLYLTAAGGAPLARDEGACCALQIHAGRVMLTPVNGAGVSLNGQSVTAPREAAPGDRLTFTGLDSDYTFITVVT